MIANWQQPWPLLLADEKSLRASPGLKRGGSRLSKLGGLESRSESTSSRDAMTLTDGGSRDVPVLAVGRAATGSPRLPSRNGIVQELDLHGVEVASAPFVPLGVDPHSEGVFPF